MSEYCYFVGCELEFSEEFWRQAELEGDRVYIKYLLDMPMTLYCNGWELG